MRNSGYLICVFACIFFFQFSSNVSALYFYDGGYDDTGFIPDRTYLNFGPHEYLNLFSGNLLLTNTDLHLPGNAGFDLDITRIYNSKQHFFTPFSHWVLPEGAFGFRWDFFFGRLIPNSGNSYLPEAELTMSDGSVHQIYTNNNPNINGKVDAEFIADNFAALDYDDFSDSWTVKLQDGKVYLFNQSVEILGAPAGVHYYPSSITDTNGNTISIQYYDCCNIENPEEGGTLGSCSGSDNELASVPHIKQVTDSVGRVIKFNWLNNRCRSSDYPNVISSIEVNDYEYRYLYSPVYTEGTNTLSGYMLVGFEPPEGTGWRYDYEWDGHLPNGELKTVYYPSGAVVRFEYDTLSYDRKYHESFYKTRIPLKTRVLVRRTVSGPELASGSWEFSYGFPSGVNTTHIKSPCGGEQIYYFFTTLTDSYLGGWASSLPYKKQTLGSNGELLQSETFSWSPYIIGDSEHIADYYFSYPLLDSNIVSRDGIDYSFDYRYDTFYSKPTAIIENDTNNDQLKRTTKISYFENLQEGNYIAGIPEDIEVEGKSGKKIVINNVYDEKTGNLLSQNRSGITSDFAYYPDGNLKWIKNAKGVYTHFAGYDYSRPTTIKYGSLSQNGNDSVYTVNMSVNRDGTVRSITDGRGYTTGYRYDGVQRLTKVIPNGAGEAVTEIEYDNKNGGYFLISKENAETINYLDGFGRTVESISNAGIKKVHKYDHCGRLVYQSGLLGLASQPRGNSFSYDELGRISGIKRSDGSQVSYEYRSNSFTRENERGLKTVFKFRSYGHPDDKRLVEITDSQGIITTYDYDIFGNLTRARQPGGIVRTYNYNNKNLLISKTEPESGSILFSYDEVGNMTARRDSNGNTVLYSYDNLNRLNSIDHPGEEEDVNYTYDNADNIVSISSSHGSFQYLYEYDSSNRLSKKSVSLDNGTINYDIDYSYDARNNLTEILYPSGRSVRYRYDNANRIVGILDGYENSYLGNFVYHPSGAPVHYENTYGVSSEFTYDTRDRLRSIKVSRPYPELRILKEGLGDGAIKSINIPGINCGNDCSQVYPGTNTEVVLDVEEESDSVFIRWTGDPGCESTDTQIRLDINQNKTCVAVFSLRESSHRLTVGITGSLDGTVESRPPGISCKDDCEEVYIFDTEVILTPFAENNSSFVSWSGDPDCIDGKVIMNRDIHCIAVFEESDFELTIRKAGSGSGVVKSESGEIDCGTNCSHKFPKGYNVSLKSIPDPGSEFTGWRGDPDCRDGVVIMDSNKNCVALFAGNQGRRHSLNVEKAGDGTGLITSQPEGIECGVDCDHLYFHGQSVQLDVSAGSESVFNGWGGDSDCLDGALEMTSDISCTAQLDVKTTEYYGLEVNIDGDGAGTVTSHPSGIDCGSDCQEFFEKGTGINLDAIPGEGSVFIGWSGDQQCSESFTITSDMKCTASFIEEPETSFYNLTIELPGGGNGVVTDSSGDILCGIDSQDVYAECESSYEEGTEIELFTEKGPNSGFGGWFGQYDCTDGIVTMDGHKRCIAYFWSTDLAAHLLTVNKAGSGSGYVSSFPEGINCGRDCAVPFYQNKYIHLVGLPNAGSVFSHWEGDPDCEDAHVLIDSGVECTAVFEILSETGSPGITFDYTPAPNENGWYGYEEMGEYAGSGVEVKFSCESDDGAVISSCSSPVTVREEGIHNITGTAEDNSGNISAITAPVMVDTTFPYVEITNYKDGDVAKLTEVIPVNQDQGIATVRGVVSDNLSGAHRVECHAFGYATLRQYLLLDDVFQGDESDLQDDVGIISGNEFECEVKLNSNGPLNGVSVRLYDKAGNPAESHIDLIYYGYTDTTPPVIEDVTKERDICYDSLTNTVNANFSISATVTDDRSGPDFDTDHIDTSEFPIDMDFDCTDNGQNTSLCSGGGSSDASNIYSRADVTNTFYSRETLLEYSIEDRNGNVASQAVSIFIPTFEELPQCDQQE